MAWRLTLLPSLWQNALVSGKDRPFCILYVWNSICLQILHMPSGMLLLALYCRPSARTNLLKRSMSANIGQHLHAQESQFLTNDDPEVLVKHFVDKKFTTQHNMAAPSNTTWLGRLRKVPRVGDGLICYMMEQLLSGRIQQCVGKFTGEAAESYLARYSKALFVHGSAYMILTCYQYSLFRFWQKQGSASSLA